MPEDPAVAIGRLRWPIYLARRDQAPDPDGTSIVETYGGMQLMHADIQAVGALTFRDGVQTDSPFTHRVFMRWTEAVETTECVFRATYRRDGTIRAERFRVRRWKEVAGRKRFVLLEVELEGYLKGDGSYGLN